MKQSLINWEVLLGKKNKATLKKRITEIAAQLLEVSAKRRLVTIDPIEFDLEKYENFCRRFKYTETEEQLNTINDIRKDLDSGN